MFTLVTLYTVVGIIKGNDAGRTVSDEPKLVTYKMFLEEPLRAKFKSLCALEGVSMNEVLVELIKNWISERESNSSASRSKS